MIIHQNIGRDAAIIPTGEVLLGACQATFSIGNNPIDVIVIAVAQDFLNEVIISVEQRGRSCGHGLLLNRFPAFLQGF